MIRIPEPKIDYGDMIDSLISKMDEPNPVKLLLANNKHSLVALEDSYRDLLNTLMAPISSEESDSVAGSLTGTNLKKLYTYNFYRSLHYDEIRSSSDICPYCLSEDRPKTLDHFLPKSNFYEYSILPLNLVPACRDCNSERKRDFIPKSLEELFIHPYLDFDCFFNEQWIDIEVVIMDDIEAIRYYPNPPEEWSPLNRKRAKKFFYKMELDTIFLNRSKHEFKTLKKRIERCKNNGQSQRTIRDELKQDSESWKEVSVNHWKVVLFNNYPVT